MNASVYRESTKYDEHLTEQEKLAVAVIKSEVSLLLGSRLRGLYLFGSKARGDYDPGSDVDLAVLVEGLDRRKKSEILDIVVRAEVTHTVVISALVISSKDFSVLRDRERRIALDIDREGITV